MVLPKKIEPAFTNQTLEQIKSMENEFKIKVKDKTVFYGDKTKKYDVYFYKNFLVCKRSKILCIKCGQDISNTYKQKYCSDQCARAK